MIDWIDATHELPDGVRAGYTTRLGGASEGAYLSANMATHVGDVDADVRENRRRLLQITGLADIRWLKQVHGSSVVKMEPQVDPVDDQGSASVADAQWTDSTGIGLAILSADCFPVVIADASGGVVGIAHCGWRGAVSGVLKSLVVDMRCRSARLNAWMGPGICKQCYEVGPDVVARLDARVSKNVLVAGSRRDRWFLDLPGYLEILLQELGIERIFRSPSCSYQDENLYSFRRDKVTGRVATIVWRETP
ncbi:MAG: peptidoglycan editing factor PgeF [Pseudomonadota bacterium]|nr:peptidoglycan editing factor PgeF [Pseudomonadota bacterium]